MAVALSDQLLHANCLLKDGYELRIFEPPRVEPYRQFTNNEKMEWLTGDFMSIHDVSNAIEGVDVVLHLISTTLPKSSNDDMVYDGESNLVPTLQLLNAMVAKAVHKIVFISSGGTIYGTPTHIPIAESHPTEPLVSYGVTKLASEKYLLIYQHLYGIKAIILRVANPFGERQRIETAQGAVGVFLVKPCRINLLKFGVMALLPVTISISVMLLGHLSVLLITMDQNLSSISVRVSVPVSTN